MEDFIRHERDHCEDITDALGEHWRDYAYNEAIATLGTQGADYHFYGEDLEKHMNSDLHRILRKIDIILSQQMSEFIDTSIAEWRSFFLSFAQNRSSSSSSSPRHPTTLTDAEAESEKSHEKENHPDVIPCAPPPLLILEVRVVKDRVCLYPDPET